MWSFIGSCADAVGGFVTFCTRGRPERLSAVHRRGGGRGLARVRVLSVAGEGNIWKGEVGKAGEGSAAARDGRGQGVGGRKGGGGRGRRPPMERPGARLLVDDEMRQLGLGDGDVLRGRVERDSADDGDAEHDDDDDDARQLRDRIRGGVAFALLAPR